MLCPAAGELCVGLRRLHDNAVGQRQALGFVVRRGVGQEQGVDPAGVLAVDGAFLGHCREANDAGRVGETGLEVARIVHLHEHEGSLSNVTLSSFVESISWAAESVVFGALLGRKPEAQHRSKGALVQASHGAQVSGAPHARADAKVEFADTNAFALVPVSVRRVQLQ